jgi:hypothetical protein
MANGVQSKWKYNIHWKWNGTKCQWNEYCRVNYGNLKQNESLQTRNSITKNKMKKRHIQKLHSQRKVMEMT